MKLFSTIVLAALILEGKADDTLSGTTEPKEVDYPLTDSLEHCIQVAEQFRNTCTTPRYFDDIDNGELKVVDQMESETITCSNWPVGLPCDFGVEENGDCKWERKLCVTCYRQLSRGVQKEVQTMIRVQTNNMPDHCPGNSVIRPQNFDYSVRFNVQDPIENHNFEKEENATAEVCPLTHEYKTTLRLTEQGPDDSKTQSQQTLAIAINGVAFQNANQEDDDPVFPIGRGEIAEQPLDVCMGHNQRNNDDGMYHYHFFSPCLNKEFNNINATDGKDLGSCLSNIKCKNDIIQWALDGYEGWNGTIIALSKDGRPVYGPYDGNGKLWKTTDVDACNGVKDNEYYFYVSTQWHPYISGCQGPTNKIHEESDPFYADCSKNGIKKYMDDSDCESESFTCATHRHCGDSCNIGKFCDAEDEICTPVPPVLDEIPCSITGGAEGCRTSADCCEVDKGATCISMVCRKDTKPSAVPSEIPSLFPSSLPSSLPSSIPSELPSLFPSITPSLFPSESPSLFPSFAPSGIPSLSFTPSCIPCYDVAPPPMENKNKSCSDSTPGELKVKCNLSYWAQQSYCELSCYKEGYSYGNACCVSE